MQALIKALAKDYRLKFKPGPVFSWSPRDNLIIYPSQPADSQLLAWSLLHEVGHALLKHQNYESDLELLILEAAAWHRAQRLGRRYNVAIDDNHIQDCLDTYRDWLHKRSACPRCLARGLQASSREYQCINCGQSWRVTATRFCRAYRKSLPKLKAPA